MCSPAIAISSCRHELGDLRPELRCAEWLRDVRDRAARDVPVDLLALHGRGDEDDARSREMGPRSYRVAELKAIHLGHRDVGEHDIGSHALDELETLAAV